ncbi:MAG TPA: hypothetical protein VK995_04860, partial [Oceanipulchritudo sp.]|nr:hypothetical protein [Oceanipulchritudo sp.]
MKTDNIQHIIKWCWIWLAVISAQQAATALETVVECHMLPYGVLGIPLNYCVDVSGDGSRVLVVVPGWENMA